MNLSEQESLILTAKILGAFIQGMADEHGFDVEDYSAQTVAIDIQTGEVEQATICIGELIKTAEAMGAPRDRLHS